MLHRVSVVRRIQVGLAVAVAAVVGVIIVSQATTPAPGGVQGITSHRPKPHSNAVVGCSGDVTSALQSAVDGGGTVNIGAGTCALSAKIAVRNAVVIDGAGITATFLVQHADATVFAITGDGVTVENIDLNTVQYHPGIPPIQKSPVSGTIFDNANNTTLLNVSSEAGTGFGMRFVGPSPCSSDVNGGLMATNVHSTNTGQGGFTAFDVDCQHQATLTNLTISGDYVALFQDQNVTLDGETYTPDAKTCQFSVYVTGPGGGISVSNVSGGGGVKVTNGAVVTQTNITKAAGC